jgi:hypothetical protein
VTYLIASYYLLMGWLFLLFYRGNKREQIAWSGVGVILGPLVEQMHLRDWWMPKFVCQNCAVHIEDLIFGLSVAGITGVIYNDLWVKKETRENYKKINWKYIVILGTTGMTLAFIPYLIWGINSFYTVTGSALYLAAGITIKRPDLFKSMIMSGLMMMLIALPFYGIGLGLNPNWIQEEWRVSNLSGIYLWKIPIEELIWFFGIGLGFSGFWEMMTGIRFRKV